MAIAKNTAKAAEPKAETKEVKKVEKAAPKAAPKAETKAETKAVAKVAPKEAPVVVEAKPEVEKVGRKDLGSIIRDKVMASGAAISPKVAEIAAVAYEEAVVESLATGKQVSLPGFGTFSVVDRPEAIRPNPQKPGETITVPAHKAPKFKAGSKLKQAVNGAEVEDQGEEGAE